MCVCVCAHLVKREREEAEGVAGLAPYGAAQGHGEPSLERQEEVGREERVSVGDSCILRQQTLVAV